MAAQRGKNSDVRSTRVARSRRRAGGIRRRGGRAAGWAWRRLPAAVASVHTVSLLSGIPYFCALIIFMRRLSLSSRISAICSAWRASRVIIHRGNLLYRLYRRATSYHLKVAAKIFDRTGAALYALCRTFGDRHEKGKHDMGSMAGCGAAPYRYRAAGSGGGQGPWQDHQIDTQLSARASA